MRYLRVGVLGLGTAVALLVRVDAVCAQPVTAGMLRADGPFAVGVTRLTYTKSSVATGEPRALTTPVWFPIDGPPGGDPQSGATVRRGKWPLILFSHGDCSLPELSTFFTAGVSVVEAGEGSMQTERRGGHAGSRLNRRGVWAGAT